MKTSDKYSNGQLVSEQKGDTLTYFFKNGDIKARGKCVNGKFQGKWIFNKKEGFLWQVGHFKDHKKHGKWIRYKPNGSVEKEAKYINGKEVK